MNRNFVVIATFLISIAMSGAVAHASLDGASGAIGDNCKSSQAIVDGTVINRFFTMAQGCLLWVTPKEKPALTYREYFFDERGAFRIFESTPGEAQTSTGSRVYFLFPRKQVPVVAKVESGVVTATLSSGGTISFATQTTRIAEFAG